MTSHFSQRRSVAINGPPTTCDENIKHRHTIGQKSIIDPITTQHNKPDVPDVQQQLQLYPGNKISPRPFQDSTSKVKCDGERQHTGTSRVEEGKTFFFLSQETNRFSPFHVPIVCVCLGLAGIYKRPSQLPPTTLAAQCEGEVRQCDALTFCPKVGNQRSDICRQKKVSICIITTSNAIKAIDNLTITHTADQSPLRQNILKVHRAANLMGRWVAWNGRKVLFHHQWNTQETATENSLLLWRYSCSPLRSARTDPSSILTCKFVIFLLCDPLTLGTL